MWRRRELTAALAVALAPCISACTAETFVGSDGGTTADGGGAGDGGDAATGCACTAPQICCVYMGTPTTYMCAQTCTQPQNGQDLSQLACTSTADCAGQGGGVCCISRSNNVNQSVCQSQCDSTQAQLCDPTAVDPGCGGLACSTSKIGDWKLPPTFGTCGGAGVP